MKFNKTKELCIAFARAGQRDEANPIIRDYIAGQPALYYKEEE